MENRCVYEGKEYSDGRELCQTGKLMKCRGRMRDFITGAMWGLLILGGTGHLRADNLLVNGSFETYSVPPANWWWPNQIDCNIGVNSLNGWTVAQNIDIISTNVWSAHDGNNSLDLCGTPGNGGVSQTISTEPGGTYNIRFFLSGNPDYHYPSEPTTKTLSVTAAGQSTNFAFDVAVEQNSFSDMKWKECNFTFTANSNSTTLSIDATMGADYYLGPVIDDVSVVAVSPSLFVWLAVELGWCSDTNQIYQVQWCTELDTNAWTNLGAPVRGNGTTNFLFDTTRAGPRRFYRLLLVP